MRNLRWATAQRVGVLYDMDNGTPVYIDSGPEFDAAVLLNPANYAAPVVLAAIAITGAAADLGGAIPMAQVSGIPEALDGKAPAIHAHAPADVTGFAEAVDDRVAALLVAGSNITMTYNDGAGTMTVAAAGGSAPITGTATVDFGAFPGSSDASVTITGQAAILAGAKVAANLVATATADHSADEHWVEGLTCVAGNIVAATGFTIYLKNTTPIGDTLIYGLWSVAWQWAA